MGASKQQLGRLARRALFKCEVGIVERDIDIKRVQSVHGLATFEVFYAQRCTGDAPNVQVNGEILRCDHGDDKANVG